MVNFFPRLKNQQRAVISLIFLSVMVMIFSAFIVVGFWGKPAYELLINLRIFHFFIALGSLIALFFLRNRWSEKIAKIMFAVILSPIFVIAWVNHTAMIQSDESWTPFKGFYVIIMGLTLISPAGYLINFYFLLGFTLEIILIWFVLNIGIQSNIVLSGEPYYVLGTSFICLLLLISRYQDEKKLKHLTIESTKVEFAKNLARVLLTIRDRMNTPLQNLNLLLHILRTKNQLPEQRTAALDKAIQDLIMTNRQFNQLESLVDWQGNNLMSSEEIESWLNSLGQKKDLFE